MTHPATSKTQAEAKAAGHSHTTIVFIFPGCKISARDPTILNGS
jgi:hypothetical protein